MARKHRQVRAFRANGKRFRVGFKPNLTLNGKWVYGLLDHAIRKVWIHATKAKEESLLDTRIHEFTHAYFDDGNQRLLHEDTVERFSTELAIYLWRCGYRCPSDEEWGD